MPVIREDKLLFEFPDADGWYALKYDEIDPLKKGFYRERVEVIKAKGLTGIKGIDIIASVGPDFLDLNLIEIKDFRQDEAGLWDKVSTGEIPVEIVQKALHTWGALCLGARHGDDLLAADLRNAILRSPQRLRVIFFLAQLPIRQSPHERDTRQKENARRRQRQ